MKKVAKNINRNIIKYGGIKYEKENFRINKYINGWYYAILLNWLW